MGKSTKLVSAIDVGSNTIRMIIAEIGENTGINIIDEVKKPIDIGKDTYNYGKISIETIKEACKILKNFKKLMLDYRVTEYRAVSTSGIRESANCDYVLEQIRISSGLSLEIINNAQERLLTYKAIEDYLPDFTNIKQAGVLIVDIGSGGVEVSLYYDSKLQFTEYVKIGSLRVMETLADLEKITLDFASVIEDYIESNIYILKDRIKPYNLSNFIGIGGEFTEIYKISKKTDKEKSIKFVSKENLTDLYKKIKQMNTYEVAQYMQISEKQAEMVLPTLVIFKKFVDLTHAEGIYAPRVSLRHGILADMADNIYNTKRKEEFLNDILSSVAYLGKRYRIDDSHALHVREMAIKIFDKTKKIHELGSNDRFLLEIAALLHDIGKYINLNEHIEHSYSIIKAQDIMGISDSDLNIIAHTARFHNEENPKSIESYQILPYENRIKISKLSSILKLCDAMDITHKRKIKSIDIKVKDTNLIITAHAKDDIPLEKWYFMKKADFFEDVTGYRPILKVKG